MSVTPVVPFIVYESGNVPLAFCVLERLKRHGLRGVIICPYYLPKTESYVKQGQELGIPYLYEADAFGSARDVMAGIRMAFPELPPASVPDCTLSRKRLLSILLRIVRSRAERFVHRVQEIADQMEERVRQCARILATLRAPVALLSEDNVERDSYAWIRACHQCEARAAVISYGQVDPKEFLLAYSDRSEYQVKGLRARLLMRLFRRWTAVSEEGIRISRLPISHVIAHEWLKVAPKDPLLVNTGPLDHRLIESAYIRERYLKFLARPLPFDIVGSPMFDMLYDHRRGRDALRAKLEREYGIPRSRRLAIVALPPNQYPHRMAPEFADFTALAQHWVRALRILKSYSILVSAHPTLSDSDLAPLRAEGIPVIAGGVANILAGGDLFIASVSSTVKWARALGLPVVDYDCYRYQYPYHLGYPNLFTVSTAKEFESLLREIEQNGIPAEETLSEPPDYWGRLDGQSMERIVRTLLGTQYCEAEATARVHSAPRQSA